MLGFLSKEKDDSEKVKHEEIFFVSCSDKLSKEEIIISFKKLALTFANKLNVNKVFLHFGKDLIEYDFTF